MSSGVPNSSKIDFNEEHLSDIMLPNTCASAAASGILSNGESRKALCSMCIHSSVALHADMISLVRTMRHHHGCDLRAENHLPALGVAQHADMNSFPDVRAEN